MDIFVGVYLGLSAIFFFWLGKTVRTLQTTVKAQSSTINAFGSLLDGMKTVLASTDEKIMLERLKAHKEFVEHEKDAYKRQVDGEKEDAIRKAKEGSDATIEALINRHADLLVEVFFFSIRMMPYVPPEKRLTLIEATDFGGYGKMEERARKHAAEAPYLPSQGAMMAKDFLQIVASPKKN